MPSKHTAKAHAFRPVDPSKSAKRTEANAHHITLIGLRHQTPADTTAEILERMDAPNHRKTTYRP